MARVRIDASNMVEGRGWHDCIDLFLIGSATLACHYRWVVSPNTIIHRPLRAALHNGTREKPPYGYQHRCPANSAACFKCDASVRSVMDGAWTPDTLAEIQAALG